MSVQVAANKITVKERMEYFNRKTNFRMKDVRMKAVSPTSSVIDSVRKKCLTVPPSRMSCDYTYI